MHYDVSKLKSNAATPYTTLFGFRVGGGARWKVNDAGIFETQSGDERKRVAYPSNH